MAEAVWNGKEWVVQPETVVCPNCGSVVERFERLSTGEARCIRCSRQ